MKYDDQPALPGFTVPRNDAALLPQVAAGRAEPAVWVAKLAVYKSWPPTRDSLLRQVIKLHRGLNILWASPAETTNEASRLAGHGAGKTTFCRLLRYVLGEEPEGSKAFREGFPGKFGNGWVLAEVFVNGKRWLVGRPLSQIGYHSFAKEGGTPRRRLSRLRLPRPVSRMNTLSPLIRQCSGKCGSAH